MTLAEWRIASWNSVSIVFMFTYTCRDAFDNLLIRLRIRLMFYRNVTSAARNFVYIFTGQCVNLCRLTRVEVWFFKQDEKNCGYSIYFPAVTIDSLLEYFVNSSKKFYVDYVMFYMSFSLYVWNWKKAFRRIFWNSKNGLKVLK